MKKKEKKAVITCKNLNEFEKDEVVYIIPKNSKILGKTIKELYNINLDEVAVIKEKDLNSCDINLYIIKSDCIRIKE